MAFKNVVKFITDHKDVQMHIQMSGHVCRENRSVHASVHKH